MSIKLEKAKGTTEAKHDRPGIPTIELLPIRRLRPNKDNARTHPKKQIRQLADSIRRYGWIDGILIDERGNIIAGHGRYEAALKLGEDRVPVTVVSGLNDVERRALALAHNKIPANAGWDRKRLGAELADLGPLLPELQLDLDITGFEPAEIDALLGELIDSESDLADVVPVLEKQTVSRPNDLWKLGDHRLLCGDATSAHNVQHLMGTRRARMAITDPPYNMPARHVQGRGRIKHRPFVQGAGELSEEQFKQFLQSSLSLASEFSVDGAIHFIFHGLASRRSSAY